MRITTEEWNQDKDGIRTRSVAIKRKIEKLPEDSEELKSLKAELDIIESKKPELGTRFVGKLYYRKR